MNFAGPRPREISEALFSGVFNSPENIHPFLLAFALDHTGNFF